MQLADMNSGKIKTPIKNSGVHLLDPDDEARGSGIGDKSNKERGGQI